MVLLQAGERVPADGSIVSGELDVDQSSLNGETKEAHKAPGAGGGAHGFAEPGGAVLGQRGLRGRGASCASRRSATPPFSGSSPGKSRRRRAKAPLKLRLGRLAAIISKFGMIGALLVALADLFSIFALATGFSPAVMLEILKNPAAFDPDRASRADAGRDGDRPSRSPRGCR